MDFVDYYAVLGLEPSATAEEIKRTYRKLARRYHPDVSKEDDAEERFKAIGEAYAALKDPERRKEYDALRELYARGQVPGGPGGFRSAAGGGRAGAGAAGFGQAAWPGDGSEDFSDFFREVFGAAAAGGGRGGQASRGGRGGRSGAAGWGGTAEDFQLRGEDVHSRLTIDLQDAHDGARLPLTLRAPVRHEDGSIGIEQRTLQVRVPVGVTDGQRIRLRGQGGPGIGGGEAGDLYIEIGLAADPRFALDGRDVTLVLPVAPWEAALGAKIPVATLGGEVRLDVPPRSSGGRRLRLKGRGLAGKPPGDQFVVLRVELPKPESDEQRALYERMAELWPHFAPRAGAHRGSASGDTTGSDTTGSQGKTTGSVT